MTVLVGGTVEAFDAAIFKAGIASLLGAAAPPTDKIELTVSAGSVRVNVTASYDDPILAEDGFAQLEGVTPTSLSAAVGTTVAAIVSLPTVVWSGSPPCRPGLTGPFCMVCVAKEGVYYSKASGDEPAACLPCANSIGSSLAMVGAAFAVLLTFGIARAYVKPPEGIVDGIKQWNTYLTPLNKVKTITGFYMLATKVPTVYKVPIPGDVQSILDSCATAITLGIEGFSSTPLECLGHGGYERQLLFWMFAPLIIALGILLVVGLARRVRKPTNASPSLIMQVLPLLVRAFFLLYPVVTKVAFDAFPCYEFTDSGVTYGYLRADVYIDCSGPVYTRVTSLATIAIAIYPIGGLVVTVLMLLKSGRTIMAEVDDTIVTTPFERRLAGAIRFLWGEYEPTAFWWESVEMLRRLVLVGLFVNVAPGTMMQVSLGTIFCAVYLIVQLQARRFHPAPSLVWPPIFTTRLCALTIPLSFVPSPPHHHPFTRRLVPFVCRRSPSRTHRTTSSHSHAPSRC